jgi:hypothetical protein
MNDEGYFLSYFARYFYRYFASNDWSSLFGSLPSNESGSVPRSLPSHNPHSRPSPFPEYSAGNLGTNVWSFLENCEESCDVRRGSIQVLTDAAGCGRGPRRSPLPCGCPRESMRCTSKLRPLRVAAADWDGTR